MPRGMHPNSQKNLKPGKNKTSFTADNAAEYAEKSHEVRRKNGLVHQAALEGITTESAAKIINAHRVKAEHGNEGSTRLIMELLGEDQKRQLEIERLRAEIDKLKAELEPPNDNDQVLEFIKAMTDAYIESKAD